MERQQLCCSVCSYPFTQDFYDLSRFPVEVELPVYKCACKYYIVLIQCSVPTDLDDGLNVNFSAVPRVLAYYTILDELIVMIEF